jgi:hypothetical protein
LNPRKKKNIPIYLALEQTLLQGMRDRGRIVDDPEEATHFWIPHALMANWVRSTKKLDKYDVYAKRYLDHTLHPFFRRMIYEYPY